MVKRIKPSYKDVFHLDKLQKYKDISNSEQPENYENKVVLKPWGYEYLIFENEYVAAWFLHIKEGYSTSMHCHPNKKTSIILLSGNALCNTFEKRNYLKAMDGIILEKTVFHSTKALSKGGINLIEIETPPNKTDLVRLNDKYGRQKMGYEGFTEMRSKNLEEFDYFYFMTPKPGESSLHSNKSYYIALENNLLKKELHYKFDKGALYSLFKGSINDNKGNNLIEKGDTIKGEILSKKNINFNENTLLLVVKN